MNPLDWRIILRVADFQASMDFYGEKLGLVCVSSWEEAHGPGAIFRAGSGRTIELFGPPPGGEHDEKLSRGVEIGIGVEDAQAWHDRLKVAGVPIQRRLKQNPWGDRSFGVNDPDGVRLWIYEFTDPEYLASVS